MKLHTATLAIFMIACDSMGPGLGGGGLDSGLDDTGPFGTFQTQDDGTQIGSEGFWGCLIEDQTPAEADVILSGFSASPAELVAPMIGVYTGELSYADSEPLASTLTLGSISGFEFVDVVESGSCADYIRVNLSGSLAAGPLATAQLTGAIGMRTDESRLSVSISLADVVGTATPLTFDPAEMDTTELTIAGIVSATRLDGTLALVGCANGSCTTDDPQGTISFTR